MVKKLSFGSLSLLISLLITACGTMNDNIKTMEASVKNIHMPQLGSNFNWGRQEIPLSGTTKVVESKMLPFDSVSIDGPFTVEVKVQPSEYYLYMKGNSAILNQTTYYIKDSVLHVFVNRDFSYPSVTDLHVIIVTPGLKNVHFSGSGEFTMLNTHAGHLYVSGGGNGYIHIEGRANRLDASLTGSSRLNAKCLKAKTIFVHTADSAQAEVANNGSVNAFATDESDIYYYETPKMVSQQLRLEGSVLRMKGIAETHADYLLPQPPLIETQGAVMKPLG